VCPRVCVCPFVRPFVCVCVRACVPVCVRVSVCYNNGNFREILRSALPTRSKKELRVTHFCYLHLRSHSICTPTNKCFNVKKNLVPSLKWLGTKKN
jgi:hypothetical protein